METLKALPGEIQMISGKGEFFSSEAQRFVDELKNYSTGSSPYTVISIIGPQNTGKSYLLNKTFGTNFTVLDASKDWRFHDTSRVQGASWELIKLIFTERVKIEARKTKIVILLRDYENEVPLDMTKNKLRTKMIEVWNEVHPTTTNRKMRDYIEVIVKDFPHKTYQPQQFAQKSKDLAKYLCSFAASESLGQNHCASSFAYSSERIWGLICKNKTFNATDHKLAMSVLICILTKNEILSSLNKEKGYEPLKFGTSNSVKEFHTELLLFLKRILTRYESETRAFDREKRKEIRDKLEKETLQVFEKTFKDKIVGLYFEKLSLAKPKVRGQLLKLAVRDRSSVIGVTHLYLAEFSDNLPADVHDYFKKILPKRRKEFKEGLTKIAEEEAKKITDEEVYKIAQEKAKRIAEEQAKKLQLAESYSRCTEIKDEILDSLLQETGHGSLESDTSMSVKEFNEKIMLYLKGILSSYDEKAGAFDEKIRKNLRDKLREQTLQRFKPTFEAKIFSLSNEILSFATCNVRGQLSELPVLNRQSTVRVLNSYLKEFDENSRPNVHPYFKEVLSKQRKEFVEGLTTIAEKKGNNCKILMLQMLQLTFEKKLDELCTETLSTAKLKVRAQLNNLRKLDESSIIDVISPYMISFNNDLPAEVPREFLVIVTKYQKKVAEGLKNIAEDEANDIQKERNIKGGLKLAGKIIFKTAWSVLTFNPLGLVDVAGDIFGAAVN